MSIIGIMASGRYVWFALVDGEGQAYNGTSASKVKIPLDSDIDDIRKSIKAECDRQGDDLKGILSSKLHVYANKDAFDVENRVPLRSSAVLTDLGPDEDKALIVVVPSHDLWAPAEDHTPKRMKTSPVPRAEWFTSELTELRSDKLSLDEWLAMTYNGAFQNLSLNDKEMEDNKPSNLSLNDKEMEDNKPSNLSLNDKEMEDNKPSNLSLNDMEMEDNDPSNESERSFQKFEMNFPVLMNDNKKSSVFVRPCYDKLFKLLMDAIKKRYQSVGVTGNPGIGKSRFYAYCVFHLTQKPIEGRILVIDCAEETYIFEDGGFRYLSSEDGIRQYKFNENVIRLIDGRSKHLFSWTGVSILFTSPGYSDYKTFLKSTNYVEYVMPPWTQKELSIAAAVADISIEEVKVRFDVFGGIARYVFSKQVDGHLRNATEAYSKLSGLEIFNVVSRREEVNEKMYPHRLLHMFPQHSSSQAYCGFYVTFGSNNIAEKVYDKLMNDCTDALTVFMVTNAEDTNSSGFRGKLFEIFCHRLWTSSGEHRLVGKLLHSDSQSSQEAEYAISIPAQVELRSFSKLSEIESEFAKNLPGSEAKAVYFRPKQKNFACIDAIYWNGQVCYLLQMTISNDYGIAHESLVKIHKWSTTLGIKYEYVFVVPKHQVEDYKIQKFLTTSRHVHKTPSKIAQGLVQYAVGVEIISKK